MNPDLIKLPWETLLTLASGYAGYFIANVGVRDHHKTIDTAFTTLLFGFLAIFVYSGLKIQFNWGIAYASLVAFGASLGSGALWAKWGRKWFYKTLRRCRISYNDELPNAWMSLFGLADVTVTQLSVKLKDGTRLSCANTNSFVNQPNGACVLGAKGDILMYVTHCQPPGRDEYELDCVTDAEWGAEITYIPADQIARIEVRRKPVQSRLGRGGLDPPSPDGGV